MTRTCVIGALASVAFAGGCLPRQSEDLLHHNETRGQPVPAGSASHAKRMAADWRVEEIVRDGEDSPWICHCSIRDGVLKLQEGKSGMEGAFRFAPAGRGGTFTVDVSQTLHGPDRPGEGEILNGIYLFEGDFLKLCFGRERPNDFVASKGDGRTLVILSAAK
jgi:uncharacterized protein (TIGR03067 family)